MITDVSQLVPHRGRMCWIDAVSRVDAREIVCSATVRADNPMIDHRAGRLPAWALVELVAQAAAALHGSVATPERGYLVTIRDATLAAAECRVGERLAVHARLVDQRDRYSYLEGEVRRLDDPGEVLCRTALSVVLERPGGG